MHLFSNELATYENIRDDVDLSIELPVVCDLANEFLRSVPLPKPQAYEADETLALLLKSTSPSLKIEVSLNASRMSLRDRGARSACWLMITSRPSPCRFCGTQSFSRPTRSLRSRGCEGHPCHRKIILSP